MNDATICEEKVLNGVRYQRYNDEVFLTETHAVSWRVWSAYAEEDGLEVLWSKVRSNGPECHHGDILAALEHWRQLSCPQLFRIIEVWGGEGADEGVVNVVSFMCGRNSIRTYREIHSQLSCHAIGKISRQMIRGVFYLLDRTAYSMHRVTWDDIQIHAADAVVCILPTFLWRRDSECMIVHPEAVGTGSGDAGGEWSDRRCRRQAALTPFSAILVNLLTGRSAVYADADEVRLAAEMVEDEQAHSLLMQCLDPVGSMTCGSTGRTVSSSMPDCHSSCDDLSTPPASTMLSAQSPSSHRDEAAASSPAQPCASSDCNVLEHPFLGARTGILGSFADLALMKARTAGQSAADLTALAAIPGACARLSNSMRLSTDLDGSNQSLSSLTRRFSAIPSGRGGKLSAAADAAISEISTDFPDEDMFKCGFVRGLDYLISAAGTLQGERIDFTVRLEHAGSSSLSGSGASTQVVKFPFDLKTDTCDAVASEMAPLFTMESTDRDMTAAVMREVIAKTVPGLTDPPWTMEGGAPPSTAPVL